MIAYRRLWLSQYQWRWRKESVSPTSERGMALSIDDFPGSKTSGLGWSNQDRPLLRSRETWVEQVSAEQEIVLRNDIG
jgi:hypothetical protein